MNDQITPRDDEEKKSSKLIRFLSEPLSKSGWPTWLVYALAAIGIIYILNPTSGFLELIPDNLPLIGNLDEGVAVMLILAGIVEALEGRKIRNVINEQVLQKTDPGTDESGHSG